MTDVFTLRYGCAHCPQIFDSSAKLGGHVHAAHPEHKRALPKFLREPRRRSRHASLKRETDTWPGRA